MTRRTTIATLIGGPFHGRAVEVTFNGGVANTFIDMPVPQNGIDRVAIGDEVIEVPMYSTERYVLYDTFPVRYLYEREARPTDYLQKTRAGGSRNRR